MMAEDNKAPPPYEASGGAYTSETTTTTTVSSTPAGIGLNKLYIKTIPGILKIVQIIVSLAALICASIASLIVPGGWCGFVAGTAFFCSIIWFVLYLVNINSKFPPLMMIIELVYYAVLTLMYLIASIVAAYYGGHPPLGAYAFFGFLATIAFGVDLFFQFKLWRSGNSSHHATTTITTSEVRY